MCSVCEVICVGAFAKDYGFARQIQRAAVSIMSNIAEGCERGSRAEFHRFLTIAKASCAEVRSQLYLAHDLGYLDTITFERLQKDAEEVSRIIGGLCAKIGSQRKQSSPPSDTA
ncbi:MAG: four helix bundle protein [Chloroflexota bacterium]|nr:four helix bundle protein [Chloroflexota bacterium]